MITGADGFVGRWLVPAAVHAGWDVIAVIGPGGQRPDQWLAAADAKRVTAIDANFADLDDINRVAQVPVDAVVHLAAVASATDARRDPETAMKINGVGSIMLVESIRETGRSPRFLFVSSGEVYGPGHDRPIHEDTARNPTSPYAASKAAAEVALEGFGVDAGFPVIIARPFTHTGPRQDKRYVLSALAARLLEARRTGAATVTAGNLDAVRDFLDVRDVVHAYLGLLERGVSGETYNVASGIGHRLRDCFTMLAGIVGVEASVHIDDTLLRPADIPVLIGDPAKLHAATGWTPNIPFDRTLQDLVDAQAD